MDHKDDQDQQEIRENKVHEVLMAKLVLIDLYKDHVERKVNLENLDPVEQLDLGESQESVEILDQEENPELMV